jgi:hypothetical protein
MAQEKQNTTEEEKIPIEPPLQVVAYKTLSKAFDWWQAAVVVESWGKRQICLYLWQKKEDGWKRKQKFTVHNREKWQVLKDSVEGLLVHLIK